MLTPVHYNTKSNQMSLPPRPQLFDFHGVPMTRYFTDNWENVQNFQAKPDDILIATYPKAGNTWVSHMVDLLHFGTESSKNQTSPLIYHKIPLLELNFTPIQPESPNAPSVFKGTEMLEKITTSPRIIKTHLPLKFLPKSIWEQNCRIIYVARNIKDSVVSLFHFERMTFMHPEPGEWTSYLQRFLEGNIVFGSWYDHVNNYWEKKQTYSNIHYMFYEDMIEDTGREFDKLCSFLGLSPSAEEKKDILSCVMFENMKKNNKVNYSAVKGMDYKMSSFMRKGKVGDWINYFTVAQSKEYDEDYKKKMKNPTLTFRTEI
ncbi:hypothetical protein Q5P01_007863 [Channa striata]|uniref:Sulfotransferase n=1 Tax=Channa striata TaxID=64152 RepID=A0AA88N7J3_CHASR|nr:hypothetical protein Q5P01_007863 [Channa striata]